MKILMVTALVLCASLLMDEYKPNGPQLHVCVGAVPLEPNTDKLEQFYSPFSEWKKDKPYYVLATTKEEFDKGVKYLPEEAKKLCSFKEKHLHVFFYHGKVEKRDLVPEGLLGTLLEVQVFGIERMYVAGNVRDGLPKADVVTVHVTCADIGSERPRVEHYPVIYYTIPFDKLDTEDNGTPEITSKTQFIVHYMKVASFNPSEKVSQE